MPFLSVDSQMLIAVAAIVELMQKSEYDSRRTNAVSSAAHVVPSPADHADSKLDCFTLFGDQTSAHFRERFALGLTTSAVDAYLERLIVTSTGSNYTRLYDTFQYYR